MPAHAPSDVRKIIVNPPDGCGQPHIADGDGLLVVDCPRCHKHLTSVQGWGATPSEIPQTYDEKLAQDDWDRRGASDQQAVIAAALASLAGVQVPESLQRLVSGTPAGQPVGALMECSRGHASQPGSRFCATCGEPMRTAAAPAVTLVKCPKGHGNLPSAKFCAECAAPMAQAALPAPPGAPQAPVKAPEPVKATAPPAEAPAKPRRLRDRRLDELQALARDKGLDDSGTRTDLIGRLKGAA